MMLVASNPCFQQREGWPTAMPPQQLTQFADGLKADWRKTVQRFLALQFLGTDVPKARLRALQDEVMFSPPEVHALMDGLVLLQSLDLREALRQACQPIEVVLGERDRLVPLALENFFQQLNVRVHVVADAGHAPFVSHPGAFVELVNRFFADV